MSQAQYGGSDFWLVRYQSYLFKLYLGEGLTFKKRAAPDEAIARASAVAGVVGLVAQVVRARH